MPEIVNYCGISTEGRVALEPILFTSTRKKLAKISKFQILAVVALDQQVLTKTSLIDLYVTRSTANKTSRALISCAIDFIREFNSSQIFRYTACS